MAVLTAFNILEVHEHAEPSRPSFGPGSTLFSARTTCANASSRTSILRGFADPYRDTCKLLQYSKRYQRIRDPAILPLFVLLQNHFEFTLMPASCSYQHVDDHYRASRFHSRRPGGHTEGCNMNGSQPPRYARSAPSADFWRSSPLPPTLIRLNCNLCLHWA